MREVLRSAVFVPESKRLNVLLRELRASRTHMAVVVDEYGDAAGLVTIEDVLEQIVGEIEDEYDFDEGAFILAAQRDGLHAEGPHDGRGVQRVLSAAPSTSGVRHGRRPRHRRPGSSPEARRGGADRPISGSSRACGQPADPPAEREGPAAVDRRVRSVMLPRGGSDLQVAIEIAPWTALLSD